MRTRPESSIEKTRVMGIFAHVDAGKTTVSEDILYLTGRIRRPGRVDDGNTQLDWMTQERERGITITSAATTCSWAGHRINLIDTPGHVDFSAEVLRSMRVIDGAVIVLCGVGGVEPQTETVWMQADRERIPRILFINKLDRPNADCSRVLRDVRERLTPRVVPLELPIGSGDQFAGVVDLVSSQAIIWTNDGDAPRTEPIPSSVADRVAAARSELLDAVCETDEALLEQRIKGTEPNPEAFHATLRRATINGDLVPVLYGSALRGIGIQPLLDAVLRYLPSPLEAAARAVAGAPDRLCAAAFKIVTDPHVGHLVWVRVFSGCLEPGQTVSNPRAGVEERVSRIYRMHADRREKADRLAAGDVAALVGIKSAATGDTLCDPLCPVKLDQFQFPDPVLMTALTAESDGALEKLHRAAVRICEEDPTLALRFDPETREHTLAGMGELHLEVAVERLRAEFGCTPLVGPPRVAYRETIRRTAEASVTYRKQTGGHGHFARVHLRVEPLPRGSGVQFRYQPIPVREVARRHHGRHPRIPEEYVRPVELGVRDALENGPGSGYAVMDVRATLLGGRFHEVDSCGQDFRIAGSMAVREALRRARPALLEPVMRLNINTRQEFVGCVTADLGRRRGKVKSIRVEGNVHSIEGEVPLAEVRGYATDLRSLTQGRSTFVLEFLTYAIVPDHLAEEIRSAGHDKG